MGDRDKNPTLAGYIELDEAYLGGRKRTSAWESRRLTEGPGPRVMVESENMAAGNLVMKVIPDNSFESIQNVVAERVDDDPPGQLFRADGLGRHHAVRLLGHHLNMSVMTKEELNTMMACLSLAVSHVKRFFKGTYHHFAQPTFRIIWTNSHRWNRRHIKRNKAQHLTACVLHPALPAKVTHIRAVTTIAA